MSEELLKQAMELFNTNEKWESFRELVNMDRGIQEKWWKKLQLEVYNREIKNSNENWSIHIWNNWDIMWFIKGASNKSLAIHFWCDGFRIFSNYGELDPKKVEELTNSPKFDSIRNAFDRIDGRNWETIAGESRNFSFGTPFDENFPNSQILSWYAGNKTNDFADQIIAKVRKLQTSEITSLFKEINETCKR